MCGLVWLGYHSIRIWAQGMEGTRLGEFAAVAEQIRQDVKGKLDDFLRREQNRPYTDYLYYYVPENVVNSQQQTLVLRSPLAGQLEQGLAYGNFQIEPDGTITTPNDDIAPIAGEADLGQRNRVADFNDEFYAKVQATRLNIKNNLLPVLGGAISGSFAMDNAPPLLLSQKVAGADKTSQPKLLKEGEEVSPSKKEETSDKKGGKGVAFQSQRGKSFPIESLQNQQQKPKVVEQRRSIYERNITSNVDMLQQRAQSSAQQSPAPAQAPQTAEDERHDTSQQTHGTQAGTGREPQQITTSNEPNQPGPGIQTVPEQQIQTFAQLPQPADRLRGQSSSQGESAETVQIRIEPFEPLVVPGGDAERSIFGGQVFLLRHVQIEDKHFLQGFQLNEKKLTEEVKESARRFMRDGMDFELSRTKDTVVPADAAYTAILNFGFGELVLHLKEIDPARISKQIQQLQNWYLSIVTVVLLAVTLGLASLLHNARAQIKLAQKKDDFISAVSHELRTPLTSIRMYAEMLEKNWVKSEDKLAEYYRNMRQESERLSRLIENVLDFSRIQKGRKTYTFKIGDINKCIASVVEVIRPYAQQNGFSIKTEFAPASSCQKTGAGVGQTAFDGDAVTQIVVNLLDNAIKYARNAEDKTIMVRTKFEDQFTLIEVEDHGPGVPHRQRKKIFEEFYRIGPEATRETTGTGLGLALVKKFAQAHNGFVEIITAKPTGAIFRVGLSTHI
jgi:signal transduction histidine kinase